MKLKTLGSNPGQYDLWVPFLSFGGVRPMPAKTAMKAENHSKEGPINTTVGKSGVVITAQCPFMPETITIFLVLQTWT